MRKLLRHMFSLYEDEITSTNTKPSKGKNLMLQLTALLTLIGKTGKLLTLSIIAIALIFTTWKLVSHYTTVNAVKVTEKVTLDITKKAEESIVKAKEIAAINTDAVVVSKDITNETTVKKNEIDKVINDYITSTKQPKPVVSVPVKEKTTNSLNGKQLDTKVEEVVTPSTHTKASPKAEAISALSNILDNEISNLPELV